MWPWNVWKHFQSQKGFIFFLECWKSLTYCLLQTLRFKVIWWTKRQFKINSSCFIANRQLVMTKNPCVLPLMWPNFNKNNPSIMKYTICSSHTVNYKLQLFLSKCGWVLLFLVNQHFWNKYTYELDEKINKTKDN